MVQQVEIHILRVGLHSIYATFPRVGRTADVLRLMSVALCVPKTQCVLGMIPLSVALIPPRGLTELHTRWKQAYCSGKWYIMSISPTCGYSPNPVTKF